MSWSVATGMTENDHKSQFRFKLDEKGNPEIVVCPYYADCRHCRFVLSQYFHKLRASRSRLVLGEYLHYYRFNLELENGSTLPSEWELQQFWNEILGGMSEEGREMLFRDELLLSFSLRQSNSRFGEIDLSMELHAKVKLKQQELSDLKFNVLFTDVPNVGTSFRCGYYYFANQSDYQKARRNNFNFSESLLFSSDFPRVEKEVFYRLIVQGVKPISIGENNTFSIPHFDLNLQFFGNNH
jgi:hypothetical protein